MLDLEIAYFTSRGIGVAEVNYGGSTGYGREYRNRLREQWGVVDVEDCAAVALGAGRRGHRRPGAARHPRRQRGRLDHGRVALAAADVYACGTIIYPILDLAGWATGETHDFESQYLETLVGPLAAVPARYRERSPLNHADRITAPFLLLQGLDDVDLPARAVRALPGADRRARRSRTPTSTFEGEGHGFRRAETMVRAWRPNCPCTPRSSASTRPASHCWSCTYSEPPYR